MRYRTLIISFLVLCLGFLTACGNGSEMAQRQDTRTLTYDEIVGTGLANTCPDISETSRGSIPLEEGVSYAISSLCMEPQEFFVKEESKNKRQEAEFISTKLLTRETSTLTQIQGPLLRQEDGTLLFEEEDGIDFQACTVLLPGGEEIPFLFTIKNLVAQTSSSRQIIDASTDFEGSFKVPSYRTAGFLDPKGRGARAGYDNAVALPAIADIDELTRANSKRTDVAEGELKLQIVKVDSDTGEIAGRFESIQPSDTDLGAREPVEVKILGKFYARVEPTA